MDDGGWTLRRHLVPGLVAAFVLVAGLGGWAATARLASALVVSGRVEVENHLQTVQHLDGGVVEAVLVAEGEHVMAGQPVLRLDGGLLRPELAIVEAQYLEALARQGRLAAERDGLAAPEFGPVMQALMQAGPDARETAEGQRRLFAARAATLARQVEQLEQRAMQGRAQLAGLAAQRAALTRERILVHDDLAAQESLLTQGLVQAARVVALRRDAARIDGLLGSLAAEAAQVEARIGEIGLQIVTIEAARREEAAAELRELGTRLLELAERRRALAERIARLELRAPVAGTVHGLTITTPRAVLRPAEPVLRIVPRDRPLVLAVRIVPGDIDQVVIGQEATVLLPALAQRALDDLPGRVVRISADAFLDERSGLGYYRAEIALDEDAQARLGPGALVPGMPVEAFIRTGERTALDYLTRPLVSHLRRAFRES